MRQKTFLVMDTETTGIASKAMVFDFAYVIATRTKILCERKFLIREILTNPRVMLGALYDRTWRDMMGGKLFHHYIPGLHSGELELFGWRDALQIMRDDVLTFGVDVICAYNLPFDLGALNKTHQRITEKNINLSRFDLLCLWEFSCSTVCKEALYHQVARQQGQATGWITPANNVRTNAEKVYAFLSGDLNFVESHTALEDAQIETEILQRLLAKRKTIPYNVLDHMPWRKAQQINGQMF